MNVLNTSKSTLGKLLAAENIRIEHRQVRGPYFDVQERTLVLPIWKDVTSDLYDLMIGHEVGHALFTPADGWMEKAKEQGDRFKQILNLVEDARIEKKMKRKFPGLGRPMYNGYTELVNRGFFGYSMDEMKSLSFLDRMNVHFKLGARAGAVFNDEEQSLIDRVALAETWDDVLNLAQELFDVAQKENDDLQTAFDEIMNNLDDAAAGDGESIEKLIENLRNNGREDLADQLEKASQEMQEKIMEELESRSGDAGAVNSPESVTQNSLEKNTERLIDDTAYPSTYVTMPDLDTKKFVVPAHVLHAGMHFSPFVMSKREEVYTNFMSSTKSYISYLVKEFELRRNAAQFAKAKVSKTGKLDINKIWKYQISEDLFLQSTMVPNGKNHGMLMLVDMSSSMDNCIAGTIEQLVSLVLFCRKVNIPFDVYGFFDTGYTEDEIEYFKSIGWKSIVSVDHWKNSCTSFDSTDRNSDAKGDLQISNERFRLKQFVHSGMRIGEFNNAIKNLLLTAEGFRRGSHRYYSGHAQKFSIPKNMYLGGTPLNESILVLRKLAEQFKEKHRVEVLNTIILTDGDASYSLGYMDADGNVSHLRSRAVIENKKNRHQVVSNQVFRLTNSLLDMYKNITDSRVIGIYLTRLTKSAVMARAHHEDDFNYEAFEQQYKEQSKEKYFGIKQKGYDVYYVVSNDDLDVDTVTMSRVLTTGKPNKTLLRAFKQMQTTKQISRVFLNQFIKQVA
jgi:hypothetical protein